jgi:hypothetical protein
MSCAARQHIYASGAQTRDGSMPSMGCFKKTFFVRYGAVALYQHAKTIIAFFCKILRERKNRTFLFAGRFWPPI